MIRSLALRDAAAELWEASLTHPFVRGIGDGTLDERVFQWYVRQDYRFLIDYGRLLSLGAARAPRLSWMRRFAALSLAVLETEMELHRSFAARWDVHDLEATVVEPATAAYCDFLLRVASLGDFAELVAAVAPCMWGYAEIGTALASSATSARYGEWIEMYASEEFGELAAWSRELLDEVEGDLDRMREAFVASSRHELAFWEAAWQSAAA
ncbi:thiaminase II [Solirubrobacter sp. CPCC 204708]|uniref:Aminopyrimidine aminohydrolase n=1 Tax=Solirubrobacter deserti TaxID=2282478 RepID=A0ABT4RKP4_9ACTN|nr:thiaminase II [Solirubrobacter deserti]MBE2317375.1 thiaminase II [Solirubrobacter deserti]MDA0139104.1 thiaminase II [Solirubrobacter deserti]